MSGVPCVRGGVRDMRVYKSKGETIMSNASLYYGDLPIHFCDVFNGCQRIGGVCDNCWAVQNVNRFARNPNPKLKARYGGLVYYNDSGEHRLGDCYDWTGKTTYCPEQLEKLHSIKKGRVIAFSWRGDWMYEYNKSHVFSAMQAMRNMEQHVFLTLTKRPERIIDALELFYDSKEPQRHGYLPNVWWGTTAWNQESLDRNVTELLKVPGKKYLMLEPLLGEVNLSAELLNDLSWVVVGAETGKGARSCDPWIIPIVVNQCHDAGVPVLVKQWDAVRRQEPVVREYPTELVGFVNRKGKRL